MKDRNVQYPYRFHVRPVPGTDDICEIIPAPGTVYEEGTFWSKQNVLQDAVAALYGKDPTATPNDIFAAIRPLIAEAKDSIKVESGKYTGTGVAQKVITFGFNPFLVILQARNTFISVGSNHEAMAIGMGTAVWMYYEGSNYLHMSKEGTITNNEVSTNSIHLNASNAIYDYVAFG